ncbi:MAG: hypothetical protein AAFV59_12915, partial [Pseudomonadota bacterium]
VAKFGCSRNSIKHTIKTIIDKAWFMEILKSTSTGTATIMNHALSMIVFIVCLMLFLLHPNFATSVFFILTVMALLDVLAGVVVTIVAARRDFGVSEGFVG